MVCIFKNVAQCVPLLVIAGTFISQVMANCIHSPNVTSIKEKLYKDILKDYILSGSSTHHIIPMYHNNVQEYQHARIHSFKKQKRAKKTHIYGERKCKRTRSSFIKGKENKDGPLSTSTCPWYIMMEIDDFREPRMMAKARCTCKRCHAATSRSKSKSPRKTGACTTVNSYVPVIRWRCPIKSTTNFYEYFVDVETVPVGCTCNRAIPIKQ